MNYDALRCIITEENCMRGNVEKSQGHGKRVTKCSNDDCVVLAGFYTDDFENEEA